MEDIFKITFTANKFHDTMNACNGRFAGYRKDTTHAWGSEAYFW